MRSQYSYPICSQPEAASDVIYGGPREAVALGVHVRFDNSMSNHSSYATRSLRDGQRITAYRGALTGVISKKSTQKYDALITYFELQLARMSPAAISRIEVRGSNSTTLNGRFCD